MLNNWVTAFIHLSLSTYPDGLWWTVQYSGMLKWRYLDYSLAWFTMMGGMEHFPPDWAKKSNVHQNCAHSPVCNFQIISP